MINKQEEDNETKKNLENITTNKLSEERDKIQTVTKQLQNDICTSFKRLIHILQSREKQLLRQVDVLHHQQIAILHTTQKEETDLNNFSISIDLKDEETVSQFISNFGKLNINGSILPKEDYPSSPSLQYIEEEDLTRDHICFSKPLQSQTCQSESVINFNPLNNKLINLNIEIKPTSIINGIKPNHDDDTQEQEVNDEIKNDNKIEEQTGHVKEWLNHIKSETEIEPSVEEFESSLSTLTI